MPEVSKPFNARSTLFILHKFAAQKENQFYKNKLNLNEYFLLGTIFCNLHIIQNRERISLKQSKDILNKL